ncbi:MAG TPA: hypothetical protein VEF72_20300 [Mycobacterium sp.]|nr:hypothetical protein [Mycobacterium sp.]
MFGFGVNALRELIVGQDHPEVVGGEVFGAAAQHVHVVAGDRAGVFVVGFAAKSGVDVGVVAVTAAAHADVGQNS